jgi:anaerobic magnesium-protoporphyrin IX monomethyl ester cyclase
MNRPDILLVNPPSPDGNLYIRDICRWGRKSREGMIWPQTSLAYLAAMVPKGLTVEIIDAIAENMDWNAFRRAVEEKKPSVYVSYVTGTTFAMDALGIRVAKQTGSLTLAIGTHPSAVPRDTLERIPDLDIVIRHEPEITFKETLERFTARKGFEDCVGIAFRDREGRIIINPDRPLVENLDELPLPAHHLLPLDKYWMPFLGKRYVWVLANRGCPFRCTFCFESVVWGRSFRFRSAESILEELLLLQRLDVSNILFLADLFTYDRKNVLKLCELIIKKGLKFRWTCNSRVDTIDAEMLSMMKKAGCWLIAVGIESGSQAILDASLKDTSVPQARHAIEMIHHTGIKCWGYFMIGLPGETQETVRETVQLAKSLPLDLALFHVAVPYPGTDFYFKAIHEGWLKTSSWELFDMNDTSVVDYPGMKAEEIIRQTQRAYREFYLRPRQIWRLLRMFASGKDLLMTGKIAKRFLSWIFSRRGPAVSSKDPSPPVIESTHADRKNVKPSHQGYHHLRGGGP